MDECTHSLVDTQPTLLACEFEELHCINTQGGRADILCGILKSFIPQGHRVAVKAFRSLQNVTEITIENELRVWGLLGTHPHIASFIGIAPVNLFNAKYFAKGPVSDYCAQGSLRVYLSNTDQDVQDHQLRFQMLLDVIRGLTHVHAQSIVHGDLKAFNVLVDENGDKHVARICDFGSSRVNCACYSGPREQEGTLPWDSPELWIPGDDDEESPLRTQKSDVWAFGCVALEVQMGLTPWDPLDKRNVRAMKQRQFNAGTGPPATATDPNLNLGAHPVKQRVWDLMVQCWNANPRERPTTTELSAELLGISTAVPLVEPETSLARGVLALEIALPSNPGPSTKGELEDSSVDEDSSFKGNRKLDEGTHKERRPSKARAESVSSGRGSDVGADPNESAGESVDESAEEIGEERAAEDEGEDEPALTPMPTKGNPKPMAHANAETTPLGTDTVGAGEEAIGGAKRSQVEADEHGSEERVQEGGGTTEKGGTIKCGDKRKKRASTEGGHLDTPEGEPKRRLKVKA